MKQLMKKRQMKNYLDLVPVSALVHRRQSRLTRFCIALSVFLISCIFSMADMQIRTLYTQTIQTDGAMHAMFRDLTDDQAAVIMARPDVTLASRYETLNYDVSPDYTVEEKPTVICGFDESMLELYPAAQIVEGRFPADPSQAVATESIRKQLGRKIGDSIVLKTPDGPLTFTLCGFTGDTSLLTDQDAFGLFINTDAYRQYFSHTEGTSSSELFVQFSPFCRIQRVIRDICLQLDIDESTVGQNTRLLALMLQTDDYYILQLYLIAAVLASLVSVAGILMISSSMNSNVARRVEFFGMLRCLGAAPGQIVRFVRREALNWCRTAVPLGLFFSVVTVWGLCAALRALTPSYFTGMPVLAVSLPGILLGGITGIITVLFAVRSPSRRASRVSPLTAISGNAGTVPAVRQSAYTRRLPIEAALGLHHAAGSKKNLLFMSGSFTFSIILFLSFSVISDFMRHAIRPLRPYTPDLSIISQESSGLIPASLEEEIASHPAVKRVYGRCFAYQLPAASKDGEIVIDLISYEKHQFHWAQNALLEGSLEDAVQGVGVLAEYVPSSNISAGDVLTIRTEQGTYQIPVAGILSDTPFTKQADLTNVICSQELFSRLTGENRYTILDIQLRPGVEDQDVEELRTMTGGAFTFSDQRLDNGETRAIFYSFSVFVYGYLAVIAMIAVLNVVNGIAMSVSARMKEYGSMRAIGMSPGQLTRMIAAETAAYVGGGVLTGCIAGLLLNYYLYRLSITSRWGTPWTPPFIFLALILGFVLLAAVFAVIGPARQFRRMSVTDTLNIS